MLSIVCQKTAQLHMTANYKIICRYYSVSQSLSATLLIILQLVCESTLPSQYTVSTIVIHTHSLQWLNCWLLSCPQMFIYLLPVSLLIFELVTSENTTNITVQVSANGSDTPSCIQNNTSCKTLMYVLDQIANVSKKFHQNTSITVNIACNQIIERDYQYNFTSSFPLSIRLIGHNNTSISFKKKFFSIETLDLTISQESKSEFNWAWIGFTISVTYCSDIGIFSQLGHLNMNTLAICNCKIMSIRLPITNTRNVVIDNTEFGGACGINFPCSVITVSQSLSVTFSNSKFSACQFDNFEDVVTFDITEHNSNITIIKCMFTELMGDHIANERNNQDTSILLAIMHKDVTSVLTINESRFIRNNKGKLLTVNALPEIDDYHVGVLLHGLDIINNTATLDLVEFNHYAVTFGSIGLLYVTLSNLSIDGNLIGNKTDWSQAVGGLELSVFSFSKLMDVVVANSKFTNNHGTPLKVKSDNWETFLVLVGNNTFSNNTGVFGGACNLQNVILFQSDVKTTVIFQDNKGIYGGALYLAKTTAECDVNFKLNFFGNKAVTSGNSVYYATSPQDTFLQCSFINISLVHM